MANDRTIYASEQEVEELRTQIRQLREESKPPNGNGQVQKEAEDRKVDHQEQGPDEKKSHRRRNIIIVVVALILGVVGVLWWLNSRHFESTDDAQVDGHISGIAA